MPHRGTNALPAGVMCRRDGRVYQAEVHVGRVERSAESGFWRGWHANGRPVVAASDPKVIDFATRRGVVEQLLRGAVG